MNEEYEEDVEEATVQPVPDVAFGEVAYCVKYAGHLDESDFFITREEYEKNKDKYVRYLVSEDD